MASSVSVLLLDQFGAIGGGQRVLLDLIAAMNAQGWKSCVLCPAGPLVDEARKCGAQVQTMELPALPSGRKSLLAIVRAWWAARRNARTYRSLAESADLLVVNGPRTLALAREWVRLLRKPALLYLHGMYGGMENFLIRSFLRLPHIAAVAASPLIAAPFEDLPTVHCIFNGVSEKFLSAEPSPDRLRQILGITDRRPIVLVPGRFSPHKGQLLALESLRLLADCPCHFVFAGAPLFEEEGKKIAVVLGEEARLHPQSVHVTHWKEALPSLYDGADLVLVPSVWQEPFGLTALEAMARSRPLIVTDRGMLPRLTDDGRVASIVSADAQAIAGAIREFLTHREEWALRAGEARRHVESHFRSRVQMEEVLRVCASLLPV